MIPDSPQNLPQQLQLRALFIVALLSPPNFSQAASAEPGLLTDTDQARTSLSEKHLGSDELNNAIEAKRSAKRASEKVSASKKSAHITPSLQRQTQNTAASERLQVYIKLANSDDEHVAVLRSLGVEVELVNRQLNKVQGWLESDLIKSLLRLENVIQISRPIYAEPRSGSIKSQGDSILKANQLRQLGLRGQGVKVGVVSDGANNWTTARSSGNLPASLTRYGSCQSRAENQRVCLSAKTCNEGTAMAEIIHDLAPDAQLAVAAVNTSLEFIQRIQQLANDFNADVIVDDLGFFGEPYFADGDIAAAVQALPKHVLYVSSAGNSGHTHYSDEFVSAGTAGGDFHNFAANPTNTTDDAMGFAIGAQRGAFVLLQWDDPFNNAQSDYDLYVSSQNGLVAASTEDNTIPFEATCVYNPASSTQVFFAQVDRFSGDQKRLKMYLLGAGAIEYPMREGAIFGHPGTDRAIAVGSINADEPGNNEIAFYSSGGPSKISFPRTESRRKPDLIAIDGVSVSGAGGFSSPFFGTSAAAPHVAGIAALLMSAPRRANAAHVKIALTRSAKDLGPTGFDNTYGHGLVDALAAFNRLPIVSPAPSIMLLLGDED